MPTEPGLPSDDAHAHAQWLRALRALDERVSRHELAPAQRDAVLGLWRELSARAEGLRRPQIGPTADGRYFLAWAYEDVPRLVVTIEVEADGRCEWFLRGPGPGDLTEGTEGEGSTEATVAALAHRMTSFAVARPGA